VRIDSIIRNPLNAILYNVLNGKILCSIFKFVNNSIKVKGRELLVDKKILVTGHTHIAELDRQLGFVNTGFIGYGAAWYMEIDESSYK